MAIGAGAALLAFLVAALIPRRKAGAAVPDDAAGQVETARAKA
ncbi:hypothetical protein ACFV29_24790 [Streptomyces sp. NPDC059690]